MMKEGLGTSGQIHHLKIGVWLLVNNNSLWSLAPVALGSEAAASGLGPPPHLCHWNLQHHWRVRHCHLE